MKVESVVYAYPAAYDVNRHLGNALGETQPHSIAMPSKLCMVLDHCRAYCSLTGTCSKRLLNVSPRSIGTLALKVQLEACCVEDTGVLPLPMKPYGVLLEALRS